MEVSLMPDSPQFEVFKNACMTRETVRLRYLQRPLRDDPALPADLRKGVPTLVEGLALRMDDHNLVFAQSVVEGEEVDTAVRAIAREDVISIHIVGESEPVFEGTQDQTGRSAST